MDDGLGAHDIESVLDARLDDLSEYIESVDFFVDIDVVATIVTNSMSRLLFEI